MKRGNTKLLNLTPHDICIYSNENKLLVTIPSSGNLRLVEDTRVEKRNEFNIPIVSAPVYLDIDQPELITSENVLVSMPVAQYMKTQKKYKHLNVYCPDTGPAGVVRDLNGKILGTKRLVQYQ